MDNIQQIVDQNRECLQALSTTEIPGDSALSHGTKFMHCIASDARWLLKTFPPLTTPPTPPKKAGPVLDWKIKDGSLEASTAHRGKGCYRIGQDKEDSSYAYAYFNGIRLATGTLQQCMQACEEYKAKEPETPELEEGWYWYCEVNNEDAMVSVWREDSVMRYRKWRNSACLPVSKAIGTFEGPLKPVKKKSQPKDNER